MFCMNCGSKIDDDSLFCSECGAKVENVQEDEQARPLENSKDYAGTDKYDTGVTQYHSQIFNGAPSFQTRAAESPQVETVNDPVETGGVNKAVYAVLGVVIGILVIGIVWAGITLKNIDDMDEEIYTPQAIQEVEGSTSSNPNSGELSDEALAEIELDSGAVDINGWPSEEVAKSKPLQIRLTDIEDVNLGSYPKASLAQAAATSTITQEGVNNAAPVVMDGDETTSWQEGVNGPGIGESLTMEFTGIVPVKFITFKNGNWKNEKYYQGNNRPRNVTIQLDNNVSFEVEFTEEKREFCVELSKPMETQRMTIVINDVFKGASYDDTCIAEIGVYGEF